MIAFSALPISIVVTAIITTVSLSLITLSTVIYVYHRRNRKVMPTVSSETVIRSSEYEIEEGKISFASMAHLTPPIAVNQENEIVEEHQDIEIVQEQPAQAPDVVDEETESEEGGDDEDDSLKRTPSQDSACFTSSPLRTCLNAHSESDNGEEDDDFVADGVHGLKRDWTEIDVSLPEVYTSSRESLLDAVVSASVA